MIPQLIAIGVVVPFAFFGSYALLKFVNMVKAAAGLLPAVILGLAAEPVIPGRHAAGGSLCHPHGGFSGAFSECRHSGWVLAYAPVTLVTVRPFMTARATRPICAQSQIGISPEQALVIGIEPARDRCHRPPFAAPTGGRPPTV